MALPGQAQTSAGAVVFDNLRIFNGTTLTEPK